MGAEAEHPPLQAWAPAVADGHPAPLIGRLERLPKWLNLVPIVVQWIWLSLRYRSVTLPSCVNPAITSGGMVGEGKMEYLGIMGTLAIRATAKTDSGLADGIESIDDIELTMQQLGISYPVVVKPDLGWCGFGVRRIDDRAGLISYLGAYPRGERIVVQEWIGDAGEAGIFYMRRPGQQSGRIFGMLLRHFPRVTGDGVRTVEQLIAADPRASRLGGDGASEACCDASLVPAAGQVVRIAVVASTRVGGMYEDGSALVTLKLSEAVDAICLDMKEFHVGRFDVKFDNVASLCKGVFTIIEVNGAGSEAVHAWDPSLTLSQAFRIIFDKQRQLFAIGDEMRRLGHRPVGLFALARHHLRQQALIRRYPPSN